MFDVEIETFVPARPPLRRMGVPGTEAAALLAPVAEAARAAILVGRRGGDDFLVWLSAERALVRLDAHREWYAADPSVAAAGAAAGGPVVEFQDGAASRFTAPAAATVSRTQALDALAHWMRTGEPAPALTWHSGVARRRPNEALQLTSALGSMRLIPGAHLDPAASLRAIGSPLAAELER